MAEKQKKDQFVIAYLADLESTDTVLSHAAWLAQTLNKGVILLHISDQRYTSISPADAETALQEAAQRLQTSVPCSYAALKGDTRTIVEALPQLIGAVAIVAQVDAHARRRSPMSRHSLFRDFAQCKTAFLVAQQPLANPDALRDVAMSVDFKKESKDKFIWSSYFPRFGAMRMNVLYYSYKDEFLRDKWYANMKQLRKLYSGLGVSFSEHVIPSKSTHIDVNALRFAAEHGFGLLIAVTTKEKDALEFFIGTQEQHIVTNSYNIPILFLNPREDLYVLCD